MLKRDFGIVDHLQLNLSSGPSCPDLNGLKTDYDRPLTFPCLDPQFAVCSGNALANKANRLNVRPGIPTPTKTRD